MAGEFTTRELSVHQLDGEKSRSSTPMLADQKKRELAKNDESSSMGGIGLEPTTPTMST